MRILGINKNSRLNPKSKALNPKQAQMSEVLPPQRDPPTGGTITKTKYSLENLKFEHWNLFRILNLEFRIFSIISLSSVFLSGCIQKSQIDKAREYSRQSRDYYQRAIAKYQDLITQGRDKDLAYFELGLLYYQQAEYELASAYLSKTSLLQAEKYCALALYKNNDFTEAREAFRKLNNPDSEALYYYGRVCDELNLYDQALDIYGQIVEEPYKSRAQNQIQLITRSGESLYLENLSSRLQEIVKTSPSQDEYPNAGALILLSDEEIELSQENTAVYLERFVIKILNERGKQNFSEVVIGYDSTYEKVELEYARTIRPDGVIIPVGSRHIRDVSKYLNFPLYSNARARIISFPEITRGCVVEYKYKIYRNQLLNEDDFVLSYRLQELEPVIQAKLKLIIPAEKPLHYKILNPDYNKFQANLVPVINPVRSKSLETSAPLTARTSNGVNEHPEYKEYLWEFKDIPAIIPEANIPPNSRINPIILISTFGSWQAVYDWWWDLTLDKIQADEAIKQKVLDLTQGLETILDKARAIYNFCAEDIRYVGIEYGRAGYEPHKAVDIFFNKYGDCKDQAILLITMLREIGLEAYPVLIGTDDYLNLEEDFPSVNFNHCIAAVRLDEDLVFLDPTCTTCSFENLPAGDQERRILVFTDTGFQIQATPIYPAQHNCVRQILKTKINPDETIQAERSVLTLGLYDAGQRFWLKYSSEDAISEKLKQAIQEISAAARLIKYDIQNLDNLNKNVILNYSFSGREYWIKAGKLRIFPQLALMDTTAVAKQVRRYPLDLGLPSTKEIQVEVILPRNFKLEYLPANFKRSSPWLDLTVEYHLEGRHLYFKQITRIKKRYILLSEYLKFKAFLEDISTQIRKRVVFRRG
jgi:hypothetical protein